jgi:hypothetical protein
MSGAADYDALSLQRVNNNTSTLLRARWTVARRVR